MKIKVTKTEEVEIEVSFPMFFVMKYGNGVTRIAAEDNATTIGYWPDGSIHLTKKESKEEILDIIANRQKTTVEEWDKAVTAFASRCTLFLSENKIPTREEVSEAA